VLHCPRRDNIAPVLTTSTEYVGANNNCNNGLYRNYCTVVERGSRRLLKYSLAEAKMNSRSRVHNFLDSDLGKTDQSIKCNHKVREERRNDRDSFRI
jgi:hypothetical protein